MAYVQRAGASETLHKHFDTCEAVILSDAQGMAALALRSFIARVMGKPICEH
jgi:hypothetical protein